MSVICRRSECLFKKFPHWQFSVFSIWPFWWNWSSILIFMITMTYWNHHSIQDINKTFDKTNLFKSVQYHHIFNCLASSCKHLTKHNIWFWTSGLWMSQEIKESLLSSHNNNCQVYSSVFIRNFVHLYYLNCHSFTPIYCDCTNVQSLTQCSDQVRSGEIKFVFIIEQDHHQRVYTRFHGLTVSTSWDLHLSFGHTYIDT